MGACLAAVDTFAFAAALLAAFMARFAGAFGHSLDHDTWRRMEACTLEMMLALVDRHVVPVRSDLLAT